MLATAAVLKLVLCAGSGQLKLATVGFTQVGLSDAQSSFYAEHFSVQLASIDEKNVRVSTPKDMAAVLGVEKQKQLLGCSDEQSSCMAELAGALGADGLVTGQLAKIGKSFQVTIKILAADGSATLFLHSSKLLATEEELLEELNRTAVQAIAKLRPGSAPAEAVAAAPEGTVSASGSSAGSSSGRKVWKLIPAFVGVVSLGVSIFGFADASSKYSELTNMANWAANDEGWAQSKVHDGKTSVTVGSVLVSVGVVLVVAGLLWFFLS